MFRTVPFLSSFLNLNAALVRTWSFQDWDVDFVPYCLDKMFVIESIQISS